MRITQVKIPKDYLLEIDDQKDGLDSVIMDRLGQIVLIAGPNGSGKSRLLRKICDAFEKQPTPNKVLQLKGEITQRAAASRQNKEELKRWLNPEHNPQIQGEQRSIKINEYERNKKIHDDILKSQVSQLKINYLNIEDEIEDRKIIYFVPREVNLKDPRSLSDIDIETRAKKTYDLGLNGIHENALSLIQDIHKRVLFSTHQDLHFNEEDVKATRSEYESLQSLIFSLLGEKLSSNIRGAATIFTK